MKILILGLNYVPEKVGIAVYTTGLAEAMVAAGHEVKVVAARPYYPAWTIMEGHNSRTYKQSNENGVNIIRCPLYIPSKPSGLKRILHHFSFRFWSFFPMFKAALFWKPDVILSVAPSLIAAPTATFVSKFCKAITWLHIQDFEVEAAFATGLLENKGFLGKLALSFETNIQRRYDMVSSISPQMCRKLVQKGISKNAIFEFRNWADTSAIKPLSRSSIYREKWNITSDHVALYSGNIANKQGINIIIEVARKLEHRKDLTFVICGEGPNRENLQKSAMGLSNVRFYDLQPKENLEELMNLATVHLLPQLKNTADLVLPSKLTNMLASARPVVATAMPGTGLAEEVEGCGLVVEPENSEMFRNALEKLLDDERLYAELSQAARQRAELRWDKETILENVLSVVKQNQDKQNNGSRPESESDFK
jgi:colanic acid biosynthesis glycosyl transferase WcaI